MTDRLRRPTMNDVASAAGVSLKSVSRVVNDEIGASPETRRKVLAAAADLGYRRNDAAHALRRADGRSASIGLVLEDIGNPFAAMLNRSVERVAGAQGSLVLAVSTNADPEREQHLIDRLLARAVDALLVMSCGRDHSYLQPELDRGVPIVFVDRPPRHLACPTVRVANSRGAADATEHLIAHGHRRIAFLGDRPGLYTADERQRGYLRAMRAAGLTPDSDIQWRGPADIEQADEAMSRMLALPDPPTAVFAGNNLVAVGVLMALRRRKRLKRVAVVGFDDLDLATVLDPPLTVIDHDPEAIGRIAAGEVFSWLGGAMPSKDVVVPVRLVARGSGEVPGPFSSLREASPRLHASR
ncbi:LacI family DNA-binding transcriptional regulator [Nakamurella sp. GG22]